MSKKALLVVSFGTTHHQTRKKTIEAIEGALAERFPDRELRRAFTSGMIMRVLRERDQIFVDNTAEAMEKLVQEGFTHVLVQPTHIINGDEYEKMMNQLAPYKQKFQELLTGAPLLTSSEDYEKTCQAILQEIPEAGKGKPLVLMGHGTGHFADAAYAALDYRFKALGHPHVFVGTVEGYPEVTTIVEQVKAAVPAEEGRELLLLPFMIVAGDHAVNDMAGEDEDSWNSIFTEAGYKTECILRGIGEFPAIQQIFAEHAQNAK